MSLVIFEVWKVSYKALYMNIRFNKKYLSQIRQRWNAIEECFTRTTICVCSPVFPSIYFPYFSKKNSQYFKSYD